MKQERLRNALEEREAEHAAARAATEGTETTAASVNFFFFELFHALDLDCFAYRKT